MIRFPNRFHASNTPRIAQVESFWRETPVRESDGKPMGKQAPAHESEPRFDFSTILAVLG